MTHQIFSVSKRYFAFMALVVSTSLSLCAQDFTVERAVNLGQLGSWSDNSQFTWQAISHDVIDNSTEMNDLRTFFSDYAPKDTTGLYNRIYTVRDNQYIVLRLDGGSTARSFYIRVTSIDKNKPESRDYSQVITATGYAYIMPPNFPLQLEVKVWPAGMGEEQAKTLTVNYSGYSPELLRTVMLDSSRIIEGRYDLQLIRYDEQSELSDTTYIADLQKDKLYSFYATERGRLREAYLRLDGFKRIKLDPNNWAIDAVTHVTSYDILMSSGPKMPYRQHRRLDAPNPSYLDSRLFSHHDTLWVNLFLDNIPSTEKEGLTVNAVRADSLGKPLDEKRLEWGKEEATGRLYIVTEGEPCQIETYRDGYRPTLTSYAGSYNHRTGIISSESENVEIFLEKLAVPMVDGVAVTSSVISSMSITSERRGDAYLAEIQDKDILTLPATDEVFYDEYASHKDTMKIVNGERILNYGRLKVALVSAKPILPSTAITLNKASDAAEDNKILIPRLEGETSTVYSAFFDYSYWQTNFDLRGYLNPNESGRAAIAFDDEAVHLLPLLNNIYIDTEEIRRKAKEEALEKTNPKGADDKKKKIDKFTPASTSLSITIPFSPPCYFKLTYDLDMYKAKKLMLSAALGIGVNTRDDGRDPKVAVSSVEPGYEYSTGLVGPKETTDPLAELVKDNDMINGSMSAAAFAEVYFKMGFPLSLKGRDWGLSLIDEIAARGQANASVNFDIDALNFIGKLGFDKSARWNKFTDFLRNNHLDKIVSQQMLGSIAGGAMAKVGIWAGLDRFDNKTGSSSILKTTKMEANFTAMARVLLLGRIKADLGPLAGFDFGLKGGVGLGFYAATGCRLDFRNGYAGLAWDWLAGIGAYCRFHSWTWQYYNDWPIGSITPVLKLITPKNYKNPYHKNFLYFLSDMDDPDEKKQMSRLNSLYRQAAEANTLPGDYMTEGVSNILPVTFLSGGNDVLYYCPSENANKNTIEIASSSLPMTLSDWRLGSCTDYHAASTPSMDLVVFEQATSRISDEDLKDSVHMAETISRASRVFGIYYTKKTANSNWMAPQPVYFSDQTSSRLPRVAVTPDGKAAAIWLEGVVKPMSAYAGQDTTKLSEIYLDGALMLSRFDGNKTWTAPVKLYDVNEQQIVKDYSLTYDGQQVLIVARKSKGDNNYENITMAVSADDQVTISEPEERIEPISIHRVGDQNVMAWLECNDSLTYSHSFRLKSYDMSGQPTKAINTSIGHTTAQIEKYKLVSDLDAQSLSNLALVWHEKSSITGNEMIYASRLVAGSDGSFSPGTPITLLNLSSANATVNNFDGYMTDTKMLTAYVATDSLGNTQLNKTVTYFNNGFNYSISFDDANNQAFDNNQDHVSLLVTINNIGTSTIKKAVLTINGSDQQYPFDVCIPAGGMVEERISLPYTAGTGISTSMEVDYEDVLDPKGKARARFLARKERRLFNRRRGVSRADDYSAEDAVYEKHTATLLPFMPKLQCYVVAQNVDDEGNNTVTICLRNYSRRRLSDHFILAVGLKSCVNDSVFYVAPDQDSSNPNYRIVFSGKSKRYKGSYYLDDYGSYEASYVTIKVPNVQERIELYAGATFWCQDASGNFHCITAGDGRSLGNFGTATLLPTSQTVGIKKVYDNDQSTGSLHVTQEGRTVTVSGAKAGKQLCLYLSSGVAMARHKASSEGKAVFTVPYGTGVAMISDGSETVKFKY